MVGVRRLQAWIPQIISFTYGSQTARETIWASRTEMGRFKNVALSFKNWSSGSISFFFTYSSRNCLQFQWSWIKIILQSQCGKQRKCETKGVESKHKVNWPSYYKNLSLIISGLFKCFIKELHNLMSLVLFLLRICVFLSLQGHGIGICHGFKKGSSFFLG